MKLKITTVSILFLILGFIGSIAIVFDGLTDDIQKSDAIVILGNKVEIDGTPSPTLQSRLEKGLELYEKHLAPLVIVSGGLGKEGFEEAEVMQRYLISHGIRKKMIIVDNQGLDTYLTAQNTKNILKERDLTSVIVVTNYFHISRTKLAFKKSGITTIYSVHANYFWIGDVKSIPRELIGYVYYFFRKY